MILQSLVRYYEALEKKEKITSPGWCTAKVSFALDISEKGELLRVIPLKLEKAEGQENGNGAAAVESARDGDTFFRGII